MSKRVDKGQERIDFRVSGVTPETRLMNDCRRMEDRIVDLSMQMEDGLISGWNPEIQKPYRVFISEARLALRGECESVCLCGNSLAGQGIDNFYRVKMFKVFTVSGVNSLDAIIKHCSNKKIIKDGLRFGAVLFYKPDYGINSFRKGSNNLDIIILFIKFDEVFCFYGRQGTFDPSFIRDNGIEFNKVLDGNDRFYFSGYSLFNNGFTRSMEFGILVVGIDKDIRINQIYGQDIPRKACPGQGLACLYDRDERLEFSSEEFSSLLFVMVLFSFSDTRQSQLALQLFREEGFLKCSLSFSVSQLASALFNPLLMIYLKLTKILSLVNQLYKYL